MSVHTLPSEVDVRTGLTGEAGNQGLGNYALEDNQEDVKEPEEVYVYFKILNKYLFQRTFLSLFTDPTLSMDIQTKKGGKLLRMKWVDRSNT